jgi:prepilin-type N-terminal cleavage/methylation domain-containing protein
MQRGVTLVELVIAILILGVLASMAVPRLAAWSDRLAVLRAVEQVAGFHRRARLRAVLNSTRVGVAFSAESLTAVALGPPDSTILSEAGPARLGVSLTASRSSIRLYPNGLGVGAANTKIVLKKGEVAGSLTVSRLGRLKRWR